MGKFYFLIQLICLFELLTVGNCEDINIVFLVEDGQKDVIELMENVLTNLKNFNSFDTTNIKPHFVTTNRKLANESIDKLCSLFQDGISIILDQTRFGWEDGLKLVTWSEVIYLKLDISIGPFLVALDEIIQKRGGNDVVLIFQSEEDYQEGLHYIIEKSHLRVLLLNGLSDDVAQRLDSLRPAPGYYSILADAESMKNIHEKVSPSNIFKRSDKWHFVFLDSDFDKFDFKPIPENSTIIRPSNTFLSLSTYQANKYSLKLLKIKEILLMELMQKIAEFSRIETINDQKFDCKNFDITENYEQIRPSVPDKLMNLFEDSKLLIIDNDKISYHLNLSIERKDGDEDTTVTAMWSSGVFQASVNSSLYPARRFFRIGTTEAIPWSYIRRDLITGKVLLDDEGNPIWEGYCIDLIAKLAKKMDFDYEIVAPREGTFGKRTSKGHWNGLVGDLVIGETDMAVAALKMTAEREEVIDFVAPYFEQTGISIVIRKPLRQTSLFKFMTVLRLEVWLSIVAALVSTAVMIWLLDKYSPYSARNNPKAYPYPCRDFSLKESLWFALTSFTPQGGGEVPKSVSARTLVAAYWLFVVLMLATFTANLAAFLTVERMQTPVQSLEQLARQSRINYTVVEGSDTHKYFINMKFAEDTLYRLWKELTLNATSDQSQYRIWDYPIKEQYGHILLAINSSNPVKNAAEGFQKVSEHENADFAFIHDSAEIKYEISKNCNLTEIGEVFAEQPYAIAIQQGSHLQDQLSFAILELQKDRYFEELTAKYWNNSARRDCDNTDENEGITLESLGGVFIATLFGLGLAMITLVCEVIYYRRSGPRVTKVKPFERKPKEDAKLKAKKKIFNETMPSYKEVQKSESVPVTLAKEFVPARKRNTRIAYIHPEEGSYFYE